MQQAFGDYPSSHFRLKQRISLSKITIAIPYAFHRIDMNLRSQSVSPQLVVSLFAAVAVNSAIWWHRSQRLLEQRDDDSNNQKDRPFPHHGQQAIDKKSSTETSKSSTSAKKPKIVSKKSQHLTTSIKKSSSPMKHPISPMNRFQATRPGTKTNLYAPTKSKTQRSPRMTPRVRESLLPWNGRTQNLKSEERTPLRQITCHDPVSPSTDSVASNFTFKSTASRNRNVQPKVRNSLLPWNNKEASANEQHVAIAKSISMKTAKATARSPRRAPRVRESLLPWNSNYNTENDRNDIESGEIEKSQRRIPSVRDSLLPWKSNNSDSIGKVGTAGKSTPASFAPETRAQICISPEKTDGTDVGFQPFSRAIDDSHVTSRSRGAHSKANIDMEKELESPLSYLKSGSIITRSPLVDSTNRSKISRRKNRRVSRELKERTWKKSSTTTPNAAVKSPTLLRLSRRADDHDVNSLCKVFDH